MDYSAIEKSCLALDFYERAELAFLLLDTVKGLSDEEVEGGEETPAAQRKEALKISGELLPETAPALVQAALSLPVKKRDELMDKLRDTLDDGFPGEKVGGRDWHEAWRVEIERRVRESDEGKVKSIPWEEVRRKAWERLNELRNPPRS